jgi:hypothetical protein
MGHQLLVRIAADWDTSGLLEQSPGGSGLWDGIRFTADPVEQCDFLVMLNNRRLAPVHTRCAPGNVWAIMQEPYVPWIYDWMMENHEPYARFFTHHLPSADPKYVASQPALPWSVGLTYDQAVAAQVPEKTRGVSWIASNLSFTPVHKLRTALRKHLQKHAPQLVDLFGRGIRPIPKKWDALAPYRYSLAVENSTGPNLWTEKVADCFLSWTVPLYFGCTNLEDYFPEDSFIRIDADNPAATLEKIREVLTSDEWERRLPALEIARRRVLEEYQIFPFLARAIRSYGIDPGPPADIHIPGYRVWRWRHRLRWFTRMFRAGQILEISNVLVNKLKYIWWDRVQGLYRP